MHLLAFEDPQHPGNSPEHHTGKPCIEKRCGNPAGTLWSPLWCRSCNVRRMLRIDAGLKGAALEGSFRGLGASARPPSSGTGQ
jgi:hypothetical protein